ncbi:MAG: type II toxin-antitoxin system RelE/ParE family toxin [Lachnospiraceae bacterium]|nr:type II toxin-antitoxin system RelE/ParE family toxin [Lachnospiraceae bacterium]
MKKKDKDSRIRTRKILDYINPLQEYGIWIGKTVTKHIEGNIWELRSATDSKLRVSLIGELVRARKNQKF